MRSQLKYSLSMFMVASLFASVGSIATAQEAEVSDETEVFVQDTVFVTARRKSESLQDVPGTVSVVSAETIASAGVSRAEDFIGLTPGVSLVNAAEAGDTQVNIRGINGARDAENSFAFILDGVLYTNPAAFNREYTNLQQIEVFKGPQGAIYGRNAAAGAIIVSTTTPGNEFEGNFTASIAEDSTGTMKGSVSGPIIEDKLYYRVGADFRTTDGFYNNQFQNNSSTIDAFEAYNINGRLVYEPNDQLSMDFKARYGEIDANSIGFNATFHLPVFAGTGIPEAFEDVNEHEFVFQPNITSDNDQEALELVAKFDYEMENLDLAGWLLYTDIENNLIADGTSGAFGFYNNDATCQQSVTDLNAAGVTLPAPQFFGEIPVGVIFAPNGSFLGPYTPSTCDGIQEQLRNQKDLSGELRLSGGEGPLDWMVGVYALDIEREVGVSLNRDSGETPIRGLLQLDGPNRTDALAYDAFESSVYAVFGSVDYDVTDTVSASLALRYDVEERSTSSLVPTDATQSIIDLNFDGTFDDPLNPGLSSLVNPSGVIADKSETFEQIQPKASVTWDATPDTTLFATYGVGFKAGGFNNSGSAATVDIFINGLINDTVGTFADDIGSSLPVISDDYDKETSNALEAGFKTSALNGRLKLEGAAYYTDVTDMQFFEFYVGSFGLLRVVSNIDEVEITGAELGAQFEVFEGLNIYAGGNITDSEIKANSSRPDTVGNKSPYTPDYTVNIGGDFVTPITDMLDLRLRADGNFVGPTWFHTVQAGDRATIFNPLFELGFGAGAGVLGGGNFSNAQRDEYFNLDLRASIEADHFTLTAFIDNATNEEYVEEVIPAPEFGGSFNYPGARMRSGVELALKF